MKKTVFLVLGMLAGSTSLVFAHPASNVDVKAAGNVLSVTAVHGVKNASAHFIDTVKVVVNGTKAVLQKPIVQTTDAAQTVSYIIPGLKAGDVVNVMTHCNKGGDNSGEIVVP